MSNIRTRMAPSPTGEYHIGSLRTLMYNYALAKGSGGEFVLRIEDTDQKREVEGATERLKKVIKDFGFDWDEEYTQSERIEIYKEHAKKLIDNGSAYYCFCTSERLNEMREQQQKQGLPKTMYDQTCRNLSFDEVNSKLENNEPYVVRLKVPQNEEVIFIDEILGEIKFHSDELEDLVLLKSDGFPTYHLAVVVDDHLMNISHVMRGNEWLPSTPKHVLLYKAFGWEMPKHAHLPNLKEKGMNKKLSKRYGDVHAINFLQEGYLPEATINFLMFLGWNPGTEKEIYSLDEFINDFSIEKIHKTDLVSFDRDKLLWYNGIYIRELSDEVLLQKLNSWAEKFDIDLHTNSASDEFVLKVISQMKDRLKKLSEFVTLTHYYFHTPSVDTDDLYSFVSDTQKGQDILRGFLSVFESTDSWDTENLDKLGHDFIKENDYKPKEAFMTLRLAVTGEKATPPIFEIMELLGKEEVLNRLRNNVG